MARAAKKAKVKCFTKETKDGGKYTTCMNSKTGKQLRKGSAASKKPKKRKKKAKPMAAAAPTGRVTRSRAKMSGMAPEIVRG